MPLLSGINLYIKGNKDKPTTSNTCDLLAPRGPYRSMIELWAQILGAFGHWQAIKSNKS